MTQKEDAHFNDRSITPTRRIVGENTASIRDKVLKVENQLKSLSASKKLSTVIVGQRAGSELSASSPVGMMHVNPSHVS